MISSLSTTNGRRANNLSMRVNLWPRVILSCKIREGSLLFKENSIIPEMEKKSL